MKLNLEKEIILLKSSLSNPTHRYKSNFILAFQTKRTVTNVESMIHNNQTNK